MITTVLRRSLLDASRRTLSASLTSINAVSFHQFAPTAATVSNLATIGSSDVKPRFLSGVKAREFHFQSGPSEFRASMVSPGGFAISESSERRVGDSESVGSDGLAISELGISPEIVKALSSKGIEKLFPIQVCCAIKFELFSFRVHVLELFRELRFFVCGLSRKLCWSQRCRDEI